MIINWCWKICVLDKYSNNYMEENPGTNSTTFLHKCLVCYFGGSNA